MYFSMLAILHCTKNCPGTMKVTCVTFAEKMCINNAHERSSPVTLFPHMSGAFLIPYILMLVLLGIPLFFLELAIGQSLRQGSIGVWNEIHPYLGGVGFASVVVCFLVGVYYNMIIAWCFYYLFASFQDPLPYSECPMVNMTIKEECRLAGRTQYYWYKNALDTSPSIEESGGLTWHLCLVLLLAWVVVFLCTMKGVQSAGKVTLFTARNTCLIGTVTGQQNQFSQFSQFSSLVVQLVVYSLFVCLFVCLLGGRFWIRVWVRVRVRVKVLGEFHFVHELQTKHEY